MWTLPDQGSNLCPSALAGRFLSIIQPQKSYEAISLNLYWNEFLAGEQIPEDSKSCTKSQVVVGSQTQSPLNEMENLEEAVSDNIMK